MRLGMPARTPLPPVMTTGVLSSLYCWRYLKSSKRKLCFLRRHEVGDSGLCPQPSDGIFHPFATPNMPFVKAVLRIVSNPSILQKPRRWAARPVTPLPPSISALCPAIILPFTPLHRSARRRSFWNHPASSGSISISLVRRTVWHSALRLANVRCRQIGGL
jgi:hypothetical protein